VITGRILRRLQSSFESASATLPKHMMMHQLGLYFIVGGICFFIDIVGFIILRLFDLPILPASALSFVTATLVNYSLCCSFVFRRGRFSRPEEIARLFLIALVGLALNSLVVFFLARILPFNPTLSKIAAVFPVFAWNYLGRRKLVFEDDLSPVRTRVAR
jgi:putative flippase GtrA